MRFLDICTEKDANKPLHLRNICTNYINECKKDPSRQDFGFLDLGYSRNPLFKTEHMITGDVVQFCQYHRATDKYSPNSFCSTYLSKEEAASIVFSKQLNRWVTRSNEQMI